MTQLCSALSAALVAILTACSAGGIQGTGDSDSALCGPCEAQPSADPCWQAGADVIFSAEALVGELDFEWNQEAVDRLIDDLQVDLATFRECLTANIGRSY